MQIYVTWPSNKYVFRIVFDDGRHECIDFWPLDRYFEYHDTEYICEKDKFCSLNLKVYPQDSTVLVTINTGERKTYQLDPIHIASPFKLKIRQLHQDIIFSQIVLIEKLK